MRCFSLLFIFALSLAALSGPSSAQQPMPINSVANLCAQVPAGGGSIDSVTMTQTTAVGVQNRYYCVWQPSTYSPAGDNKLVVVLHGGNGNAVSLAGKGLQTQGELRGYLIAFAHGWPHAGCATDLCTVNKWDGIRDVGGVDLDLTEVNRAYIAQLVDAAIGDYNVNPDEIYLAGFSGGAKMIYRLVAGDTLQLTHPFEIGAIATMAGSILSVDIPAMGGQGIGTTVHVPDGARPVASLLMQGLQDPKMAFYGGFNEAQSRSDSSFQTKIDMFRGLNEAFGAGQAQPQQWVLPLGGQPAQVRQFDGLEMVVSVAAQNLDHKWPNWYAPLVFDFFDAQ